MTTTIYTEKIYEISGIIKTRTTRTIVTICIDGVEKRFKGNLAAAKKAYPSAKVVDLGAKRVSSVVYY